MDLSERIEAFSKLGDYLRDSLLNVKDVLPSPGIPAGDLFSEPALLGIIGQAREVNAWFMPCFVHHALTEIARILTKGNLLSWCDRYPRKGLNPAKPVVVGCILAGNIPLVGFHDFLSILLSGNRFKGKMSGKDDRILPFLAEKLLSFEPGFSSFVHFEDSYLGNIDAIIATGSNNSSRYFEYYFGRYPHIFRQNRNGIALLTGKESIKELTALADDILLYFGMGCRNVAKLYVPEGYKFDKLFGEMEKYRHLIDHHKYANNYDYHRSVYLMNRIEHLDNGFLLLRPDPAISSPVATLHYESYSGLRELIPRILGQEASIQCIAGRETPGLPTVELGRTQNPELWDYADNMDTIKFLSNL